MNQYSIWAEHGVGKKRLEVSISHYSSGLKNDEKLIKGYANKERVMQNRKALLHKIT